MTGTEETWFCADCGSLDIRHDAIVKWDPQAQDWKVEGVLDNTWCEDCAEADGRFDGTGEPVFGVPGDEDATDSMLGGGA